jgi:hypothetical protein
MMTVGMPLETPANVLQFAFPGAALPAEEETQLQQNVARALSQSEIDRIRAIASDGRNATIDEIKRALKRRSGKTWSVTGGRGTAWGWITIDAPPARRIQHKRLKPGCHGYESSDYETFIDASNEFGSITDAESAELAELLGLESVHHQGVSIAASSDYYRVYICRACHGHAGPFTAEQYWD